jgi:hypothetical protein
MKNVFKTLNSFHARAVVLLCLLKDVDPPFAEEWKLRLNELFNKYHSVLDIQKLGFASDQDPFWTL